MGGILKLIVMALLIVCAASPVCADVKIYPVSAQKAAEYIRKAPGPKLIYIYTSWCPYCIKTFPSVVKLSQRYKGQVIAISLDEDLNALGRFANHYEEAIVFPVIAAARGDAGAMASALEPMGVDYPRSFPFMFIMDGNNKIIEQGTADAAAIEALDLSTKK